jgi:hypothetical protein
MTKSDNVVFGTKSNADPMKLENCVYDDFDFPTSQLKSVGANDKPDFDTTNLGYLMPKNDATEIIGGSRQFPHFLKKGDDCFIYPHIHYVQTENVQPIFKMQYRFYDIGSEIPAYSAVQTSGTNVKPFTANPIHQIVSFDPIDASAIVGNSAWCDVIIWRDDNVGTGDILLKGFDFHIPIDRLGSVGEFLY